MPRDLPVTDVMTSPVVTLQATTTVEEALGVLSRNGISGAPVVGADKRLAGVLDDSDLLVAEARLHGPTAIEILGAYIPLPGEQRRFAEEVRHALARTVGDLMDAEAPALGPEATVEDAATIMVDQQVSRIPIVDGERRVIGIITRGDIVEAMGRT
jgi:CBS domain-containing protein